MDESKMTTEKVRELREFLFVGHDIKGNSCIAFFQDPGEEIPSVHVVEASALTAAQERVAELEEAIRYFFWLAKRREGEG